MHRKQGPHHVQPMIRLKLLKDWALRPFFRADFDDSLRPKRDGGDDPVAPNVQIAERLKHVETHTTPELSGF